MRKWPILFLMLMGVHSETMQPITFEWDYADDPPDAFYIHYSQDIGSPIANWPVLMGVPGTTTIGTNSWTTTNAVLPLLPGAYFFYATASNFWGESEPSNQISTPPPTIMPRMRSPHR